MYLPYGVDICLRLNKTAGDFHMVVQAEGKLHILEAGPNVKTVDYLPVVANDCNQSLPRIT